MNQNQNQNDRCVTVASHGKNQLINNLVLGFGILLAATSAWYVSHSYTLYEQKREEAQTWYEIVSGLPGGVIVVEAGTGKIIEWNRGAELITGHLRRDVIGRSVSTLGMFDNGLVAKHRDFIADPDSHDQLMGKVVAREGDITRADGKKVHLCVQLRAHWINGERAFSAFIDPTQIIVHPQLMHPSSLPKPPGG